MAILKVRDSSGNVSHIPAIIGPKGDSIWTESTQHPGCFYNSAINDGHGTEWLNPPMLLDVVYRTAERYKGKPVYKMVIDMCNSAHIDMCDDNREFGGSLYGHVDMSMLNIEGCDNCYPWADWIVGYSIVGIFSEEYGSERRVITPDEEISIFATDGAYLIIANGCAEWETWSDTYAHMYLTISMTVDCGCEG